MSEGKVKGAAFWRIHRWLSKIKFRRCGGNALRAYYVHAAVRVARRWDVLELHAGLHAWTGNNAKQLGNDMGTLLWLAIEAMRLQKMVISDRDAHYLAHAADVLGIVRLKPQSLRLLRGRLQNGLQAIQALRPHLQPWALVDAERLLRWRLTIKRGLTVMDFAALTRPLACPTPGVG